MEDDRWVCREWPECVYLFAACTRKVCGRGGWWPRSGILYRSGVTSELIGTGGGWGKEGENEWVNGWEGGDMKCASSSPGRWTSDPTGVWVGAAAGLGPGRVWDTFPCFIPPQPPTMTKIIQNLHPVPSLRYKDCLQLWFPMIPLSLLCNQPDPEVNVPDISLRWDNSKSPHNLQLPPSVSFKAVGLGSCLSFPWAELWDTTHWVWASTISFSAHVLLHVHISLLSAPKYLTQGDIFIGSQEDLWRNNRNTCFSGLAGDSYL